MDLSNGWERVANTFIAVRNPNVGKSTLENWVANLPPRAKVLDIGCGFGVPNTQVLINAGCQVYGIDASKTLIAQYKKRFPMAIAACEAAESSNYFDIKFNAIIAIGLIFLLPEDAQLKVLQNAAHSLKNRGRFLFTAPKQVCEWQDVLTAKRSRSLGKDAYVSELLKHGLILTNEYVDEGENHYFDFTLEA
ncbi:class I SAM-dependent methyltransferase [Glaciecola siphonariae]|uniref:Class I SAM-dependent methyltransferase n=1 Tax=Glaciecola siphonariae TaxID=521012 RepID=A0ABV9LZH5_9ALTE